jgi:hypothetical protein
MDASLHHASFSMTNHSMPIFGLGDEPLTAACFGADFSSNQLPMQLIHLFQWSSEALITTNK